MKKELIIPFIKSTQTIFIQMTDIKINKIQEPVIKTETIESYGVTSVITFAGKIKGRFIIDIEPSLAMKMISNLLGEEVTTIKDRMCLAAISEMNNIIAGDANTTLNNTFKLGLRLAPPIVFTGKNMAISASDLESQSFLCETDFGKFKINIAFEGEVQ